MKSRFIIKIPRKIKKIKNKTKPKKGFGANKQSLITGGVGEKTVQKLFPVLKFIGQPGADFVLQRPGKNIFFEVKTTFKNWYINNQELKDHILLKTRDGQWVNNKAHYVIFVTRHFSYVGKASEIRDYVKLCPQELVRLKKIRSNTDPVLISIKDLLDKKIVFRIKNNEKTAMQEFEKFTGVEHKKAVEKALERKRLEQAIKAQLFQKRAKVVRNLRNNNSRNNFPVNSKTLKTYKISQIIKLPNKKK